MEFLNIEINEKIFIRLIIVAIVFIIVYMAFTMSSLLIFKSYILGPNTSVNDEEIRTHIDILEGTDGKKLEIAGWAYKEGEDIETVNSNYVIKHQESGKMYLMRTKMEQNKNVEERYQLGGIHAQCLTIGIPKGEYQILVWYRNNHEDILADTLITFELK